MDPLPRGVTPVLRSRLRRHKVVVLEGARAVGKTTVCRQLAEDLGGSYFDLSDEAVRQGFETDPEALLESATTPVIVDEAQLIDSLPLSVKRVADRRQSLGQFLLTGSSRLSRGALGGSDPLAGRASRVTMFPMTVAERQGRPTEVLTSWFASGFRPAATVELGHEELVGHVLRGGLPGTSLLQPEDTANDQWWALATEVMPTYLESALSLLYGKYDADRQRLIQTIRYLAANPAQILNVTRVANDLTINRDTARRYLELLTDSLLLHRLPSVRPTAHKSATAHPKLVVFDTAFAAWAAAVPPDQLLVSGRTWGGLVENLVALEVMAQASWMEVASSVGHWRQGRDEVDMLISDAGGSTIGIEVKAAKAVSARDARGLVALANQLSDTFAVGVVLYSGHVTYRLADQIWAVPISTLWKT